MTSVPDMVGFVANPSTRGTIQIFWTCFSTIFICVWTSLHPAVPIPESMRSEDFVREDLEHNKYALAFLTLFFPESALAGIVADYIYATHIVEDVNSEIPKCNWNMTDAYFAIMDGYHFEGKVIKARQILECMRDGRLGVMPSNVESIMDRSKTGSLQRIFACAQVAWLLLQCLTRRIVHLPMSALEMGSAGYSIVALLAFGLQWSKPKDVRLPTTLVCQNPAVPSSSQANFVGLGSSFQQLPRSGRHGHSLTRRATPPDLVEEERRKSEVYRMRECGRVDDDTPQAFPVSPRSTVFPWST
ncbi:hypothetical protein DENSPDRAFT_277854 [Dentipellis sp. KUC8613]|nr:hypothetical protein DENSPDRAFT_277854 [Dentipellis sp. KUC8613]